MLFFSPLTLTLILFIWICCILTFAKPSAIMKEAEKKFWTIWGKISHKVRRHREIRTPSKLGPELWTFPLTSWWYICFLFSKWALLCYYFPFSFYFYELIDTLSTKARSWKNLLSVAVGTLRRCPCSHKINLFLFVWFSETHTVNICYH